MAGLKRVGKRTGSRIGAIGQKHVGRDSRRVPSQRTSRDLSGVTNRGVSFRLRSARVFARMFGPAVADFFVGLPENARLPKGFVSEFRKNLNDVSGKPELFVTQKLVSIVTNAEHELSKELMQNLGNSAEEKRIRNGLDFLRTLIHELEQPQQQARRKKAA